MPSSEGCNPGKGIALEWVGTPGTGMRSEGTPHKDGSGRKWYFLDRRRSFAIAFFDGFRLRYFLGRPYRSFS
jgi:hypothetical protein